MCIVVHSHGIIPLAETGDVKFCTWCKTWHDHINLAPGDQAQRYLIATLKSGKQATHEQGVLARRRTRSWLLWFFVVQSIIWVPKKNIILKTNTKPYDYRYPKVHTWTTTKESELLRKPATSWEIGTSDQSSVPEKEIEIYLTTRNRFNLYTPVVWTIVSGT